MLGGRTHAWRAVGARTVHSVVARAQAPSPPRLPPYPRARPSHARFIADRASRPPCAALHYTALHCIPLHPAALHCITLRSAATCQRPASDRRLCIRLAARPQRAGVIAPIALIIFTHRHPDRRRCRPGCHGTLWRARVLWRVRDRVDRRATGDVDVDVDVTREASVPGGADGRTRRGAVAVFVFVFARTEGARVRRGEGAESRGGQIEPGGASAGPRALDTAYTHTYLFSTVWRRRRVMERWGVSSKRRSVEA